MNTKITFTHTMNFDPGKPNCGFDQEKDFIIVGDGYEFSDWLSDNSVLFNQNDDDESVYFVIDDLSDESRTGKAYMILKVEPTEEDLMG